MGNPEVISGSLTGLRARLDLGVRINIDPREIRPRDGRSTRQFAAGRIRYPKPDGEGYEPIEGRLLYLKSSFTGFEEEVIQQYRSTHPDFPHETTADQFFDEGQFEAYRSLGQHIAEQALALAPGGENVERDLVDLWLAGGRQDSEGGGGRDPDPQASPGDPTVSGFFERWFDALEDELPAPWSDRRWSKTSPESMAEGAESIGSDG